MVYCIKPKNIDELNCLFEQYPNMCEKYNPDDLKLFLQYLIDNYHHITETPIAFDSKDIHLPIKLSRLIYNLPAFEEKRKEFRSKILFKQGNGSNNKLKSGGLFEINLLNDFKKLLVGRNDFQFKNFNNLVNALKYQGFKSKSFEIIEDVGDSNKKRPLSIDENNNLIISNDREVGEVIADISLISNSKPFHLSLKTGLHNKKLVNLIHMGTKKFFEMDDYFTKGDLGLLKTFDDLSIKQSNLLKLFAIEEVDFLYNFFTGEASHCDPKPISDLTGYTSLLKSIFGYNYWLVHQYNDDTFKFKWFNKSTNKKYSQVDKATVYYNKGKYMCVEAEGKFLKIVLQLRNSQGDKDPIPNAIDAWYMYKQPYGMHAANMKEKLSFLDHIRLLW